MSRREPPRSKAGSKAKSKASSKASSKAGSPPGRPLVHVPHLLPLLRGRLIDRYQRFTAEVQLDAGPRVRAHCVNPGRMEGQVRPGARVWLTEVPPELRATRKLHYTWELVEELDEHGAARIVGANTVVPNRIVGALLAARVLPGLKRFRALRAEVGYAHPGAALTKAGKPRRSRIDFLLEGARDHYVEVKNAHLRYPDGRAYFPDSVSARAAGHLEALVDRVQAGYRATVLFTIQRTDVWAVRPSMLHDPVFAEAARRAGEAGVKFRAVTIAAGLGGYDVMREIPVDLRDYDVAEQVPWREAKLLYSGWRKDPARAGA